MLKQISIKTNLVTSTQSREAIYATDRAISLANKVLSHVMKFRRFSNTEDACAVRPCSQCLAPHLKKIVSAILDHQPIPFVLPAFPGKSPNPAKVLGTLPDLAERRSLQFLGELCEQIKEIYSPGARIILCSDGRVFSDAVGLRDQDITAYQTEISVMLKELGLDSISTFNLEELYAETDFDQMRRHLVEQYGESLEVIKEKVSLGKDDGADSESRELNRLYCGITRFLVEDAMHPGQQRSKTAIQKECRVRAYDVIQKSGAWSELIEQQFPNAVRLSIHPHGCGSKKLGLQLGTTDSWMTPWHGVALLTNGSLSLVKRNQAEAMGAKLILKDSRPSHFELATESGNEH